MSVCSGSGMRTRSFSASGESKRQSSTLVACSENNAKLTPTPVQVAPRGYGKPGHTLTGWPSITFCARKIRLRFQTSGSCGSRKSHGARAYTTEARSPKPGARALEPKPEELIRRVSVVEPGLRRVGVATDFPESALIVFEEFDLPDPLRALPRIKLGRDHSTRPAVLSRERLSFPRVDQ